MQERVAQYKNRIDVAAAGSEKNFGRKVSSAFKLSMIGLGLLFEKGLTKDEFNEVNKYGGVSFRNL